MFLYYRLTYLFLSFFFLPYLLLWLVSTPRSINNFLKSRLCIIMVKKKKESMAPLRWALFVDDGAQSWEVGEQNKKRKKKKRESSKQPASHINTHTHKYTHSCKREEQQRERKYLKKKKEVMSALHVITCRLRPSDYHLSFSLSGMCVTPQHPFGDGGTRKKGKRAKNSLRTI